MAGFQLSKGGGDGWERGKETISYKQDSLRNSQHKLPPCMKCLDRIFLRLRTGHFSCRWDAFLALYWPHVEVDFSNNIWEMRASPVWSQWYLCSSLTCVLFQKQVHLWPVLYESCGILQSLGLACLAQIKCPKCFSYWLSSAISKTALLRHSCFIQGALRGEAIR